MEMCGDFFNHQENDDSIKIHVFTKFQDSIKIDTMIKCENSKPKYHLLFSVPFIKKNGTLINPERAIPIDSSIRIVNYMVHNPAWDDIRK
jgi:hypothetical protein